MTSENALILGAGPAGMTAAVLLQREGWAVRVVEKAPAVGGLTRTIERDGFRFDLGGHRFYTKNKTVHNFVADLLGDDMLTVPRVSTIHFRDRFIDYPIKPLNALRNVGPLTSLAIARDLAAVAIRRKTSGFTSLEDWMVANYGRTLFETYFKVYAEKVWGLPADQIHADLAAQRVKGVNLLTTLRHALFRKSREARESMIEEFSYPKWGYGQICDRMAEELAGDQQLTLRTVPTKIRHDGKRILSVELEDAAGRRTTHDADQVVSTIPLSALVHLFDPVPPVVVQQAAASLGARAVVFAAVFVDTPSVRPESWIYFPSPKISFGRITEPRNWSPWLSPEGKTSIVAEHFCNPGDTTYRTSDAEIAETTVRDLTESLGFFDRRQVLDACVVRAPAAYPRMSIEHKSHLEVIEQYLDRFQNLQAIGRGGMFRYHNTDHVIETAFAAVTNLLGGHADVRAVNTELTYHEERRTA